MSHIEPVLYEIRFWPLIYVRLHGTLTDAEWESFLKTSTEQVKRGRHVHITDTSTQVTPNAKQRALATKYMEATDELTRANVLGSAVVVGSEVMRGALSAVFWLRKPAAPTSVHTDVAEAITWCEGQLRSGGLTSRAVTCQCHGGCGTRRPPCPSRGREPATARSTVATAGPPARSCR